MHYWCYCIATPQDNVGGIAAQVVAGASLNTCPGSPSHLIVLAARVNFRLAIIIITIIIIFIVDIIVIIIIAIIAIMGCTQNPISTLSHIWVFVRLYGIVFVIIVIIIIIIMIIKSEGVNAQL